MIASVLSDIALIVTASALLVIALAAGALVWRKGFGKLGAKVGNVEISLEGISRQVAATKREVSAINFAVNNVPPGTRPMVQRVGSLEDGQRWIYGAIQAVAADAGCVLPPIPNDAFDRRDTQRSD